MIVITNYVFWQMSASHQHTVQGDEQIIDNNKNYNYNDDDDDSKLWCQVQWRRHTRCVRTSLGENT